ncbi:hypothetical protein EVAR_72504_1 [Eumeta japonica]|uniref:Uncharacterized protein n=1 Tax=Eumeta variegata TaxID=151549 RepID=A0A4C1T4E2_EUMVA|nr:hypothetical protein EVAR_72504_1 [Eumeta japonica]
MQNSACLDEAGVRSKRELMSIVADTKRPGCTPANKSSIYFSCLLQKESREQSVGRQQHLKITGSPENTCSLVKYTCGQGHYKISHHKPPCFSCTSTSTNGWRRFSRRSNPGAPPWYRFDPRVRFEDQYYSIAIPFSPLNIRMPIPNRGFPRPLYPESETSRCYPRGVAFHTKRIVASVISQLEDTAGCFISEMIDIHGTLLPSS